MMSSQLLSNPRISKVRMLNPIVRFVLFLSIFVSFGNISLYARAVHGGFLSDMGAKTFWEQYLATRASSDYVTFIRAECLGDKGGAYNGVILHKNGQFIVEFADHMKNFRKFLVKKDSCWTNIDIDSGEMVQEFLPGIRYGPSDLLLPVVCTGSAEYCGPKKICGRMTQQFIVKIPDDYQSGDARFVKFSVDGSFHQPLQIEYLDAGKRVIRYQKVASLKKQGSGWTPKTFELFDVRARKRTKITVLELESKASLDPECFSEEFLKDHSFMR